MWLKAIVCALTLSYASAANSAIAVLSGGDVTGVIRFNETDDGVLVQGTIAGLTPGQFHGFHIHELGDLSNGCTSTLAHYNPYNATHGGMNSTIRHVGDLGNLEANSSGVATFNFTDSVISLSGANDIIGRAVVVHEDEDDYGLGGDEGSLSTGNAGARIGCAVIGRLSEVSTSDSVAINISYQLKIKLLLAVFAFHFFQS